MTSETPQYHAVVEGVKRLKDGGQTLLVRVRDSSDMTVVRRGEKMYTLSTEDTTITGRSPSVTWDDGVIVIGLKALSAGSYGASIRLRSRNVTRVAVTATLCPTAVLYGRRPQA